ncbi:MAG TPA: helix-turn-helix transcriptional regulator [Fimbriimonadaceae bacterium]|nr:helix-turn-helix transcriptional regulator [Fimbriimonadaceae bacterium]
MKGDYLDELIEESSRDPEFARAWEPIAIMLELTKARIEQGLSQEAVAVRMHVNRARVAEMEKDPGRVSFARIMAYAKAVGATVTVKRSKPAKRRAQGRGRPVGAALTASPRSG